MEPESMHLLVKAIVILVMIATAPAEAYLAGKAFEAMGRNPEVQDSFFTKLIVVLAIVESTAIFALVAFFII